MSEAGWIFLLTLLTGITTWAICYLWLLHRALRKENP